jgi:hypothetical protein
LNPYFHLNSQSNHVKIITAQFLMVLIKITIMYGQNAPHKHFSKNSLKEN